MTGLIDIFQKTHRCTWLHADALWRIHIWQIHLKMLLPRNPPYLETHISQYKFKLNQTLMLDLYHEIPRSLTLYIWWIWGSNILSGNCHIANSIENATSLKYTRSRNLNSSVHIQIKPKSQFEFVPRDTVKMWIAPSGRFRGCSIFGELCHTHTHQRVTHSYTLTHERIYVLTHIERVRPHVMHSNTHMH